MTKKELIDLLAEYPDDTILVVEDDRDDGSDIDTFDIDRLEPVDHDFYLKPYGAPVVHNALVFRPKH